MAPAMEVPTGTLAGDHVVLVAGRDASALHSKGNHGTPKPGGGLELTLVEAAYLLESGRLRVLEGGRETSLPHLLSRGAKGAPRFERKYLAYRDLRERGFVVREEPPSAKIDFSLRERGKSAKSPSTTWVVADHEHGKFDFESNFAFAERAKSLDKAPLAAIVDAEGDVTYYGMETGLTLVKPRAAGTQAAEATFSGTHVLLSAEEGKSLNGEGEMFGMPLKSHLRLSLLEAVFLLREKRLRLARPEGGTVTAPEVVDVAQKSDQEFALRLAVYSDLRSLSLLPKTGFKYGSDFRVYERGEGTPHARFLVQPVGPEFGARWSELARAVRLAHGVRKRFALAQVGPDGKVRYLQAWWARP
jgi:tRNA-intron endonuclease, archaea type